MEDICEQLDKTTLDIFQVLEELYTTQDQLEQVMSEGFLGISRTRYSLGVKRVSADQIIDAELTANFTTKISDSISPDASTSAEEAVKILKGLENDEVKLFQLCDEFADMSVETKERKDLNSPVSTESAETTGLRKRNIPGSKPEEDSEKIESSEADSSENSVKEKGEKSAGPKRRKPISLFGVLVPQTLQASRKCFEEAVKIAVNIADLKCRLNILQKEYKRLRRMKDTLKSEDVSS